MYCFFKALAFAEFCNFRKRASFVVLGMNLQFFSIIYIMYVMYVLHNNSISALNASVMNLPTQITAKFRAKKIKSQLATNTGIMESIVIRRPSHPMLCPANGQDIAAPS